MTEATHEDMRRVQAAIDGLDGQAVFEIAAGLVGIAVYRMIGEEQRCYEYLGALQATCLGFSQDLRRQGVEP